jgi:hypothetical protein
MIREKTIRAAEGWLMLFINLGRVYLIFLRFTNYALLGIRKK